MKTPTPAKRASKARASAAKNPFADGAAPGQGGAWIRKADGSLARDGDTEQPIPDDEGASPQEPTPPIVPPPPPGPDTAGATNTDGQEV